MNQREIQSLIYQAIDKANSQASQLKVTPEELKEKFLYFKEAYEFSEGDLVEWKPDLSNRNMEGPFLVSTVLKQTMFSSCDETGSSYFNEPLDIIVFAFDGKGNFIELYVDSRRLQPITKS